MENLVDKRDHSKRHTRRDNKKNMKRPQSPIPKASGKIRPRSPASDAARETAAPAKKPAATGKKQQQQQQQSPQRKQSPAAAIPSTAAQKSKIEKQQKQQQEEKQLVVAAPAAPSHEWALLSVGTYHAAVQGFTFRFSRDEILETASSERVEVKPPQLRFSGTQHTGCVHSIAGNGQHLLASSASDERIALCSIKNNGTAASDLGTMQPASTVRCMSFVQSGGGHLVCGCEDGSLAMYRTRTWQCEAVLRVHEKAIISFVPTSNGALAVTLGADRYLAFVDLTRGSVLFRHKFGAAIATNKRLHHKGDAKELSVQKQEDSAGQRFGFVHQPPRQVLLSPSGSMVAAVAPFYVAFFDLRSATLLATLHVEDPQPEGELQAGSFLKTTPVGSGGGGTSGAAAQNQQQYHLVLSTESGDLVAVSVPPAPGASDDIETAQKAFAANLCWARSVKQVPCGAAGNTTTGSAAIAAAAASATTTNIPSARIRCIAPLDGPALCNGIATASSAGEVRCWVGNTAVASATAKQQGNTEELQLVECCKPVQVGGRVTCMFASLI